MNNNMVNVMMSLIKSAVTGVLLCEEEKKNIGSQQLQEIYAAAVKHDLAPLISYALAQNSLLDQESDIGKLFVQQQFIAVYRYEQMQRELEKICNALETAAIDFIPLKGSVIKPYYPEPWMRTSCDIDILVKPADLERAVEFLCEKQQYTYVGKDSHDVSLFSRTKVHVELHYDLIEGNIKEDISAILSKVWEDAVAYNASKYHMVLSDEMFMLYHIAHMAKHVLHGGCGIRPFIDLWILEKRWHINHTKLKTMLEQSGLTTFYDSCSALNAVWFGNETHSELTMQFENYLLYGGVYGSSDNQLAVRRGKGESRFKHFKSLMFLSRENLAYIYPILNTRPALAPFYQVKRWFRVFQKEKRAVITTSVKTNQSLSNQKIENVSELMNCLDLN